MEYTCFSKFVTFKWFNIKKTDVTANQDEILSNAESRSIISCKHVDESQGHIIFILSLTVKLRWRVLIASTRSIPRLPI